MLFDDASYERLIAIRDPASGLSAVLTIDSTRRGPAFGGIRRRVYASEADAVADARRLAQSMSRKCALADLAAGGAKTVVLVPGPEVVVDWSAAYAALGDAIEALGGAYVAGPDVGTSAVELDAVRRRTAHVNPLGNDAGLATARGVEAGLRAVATVRGQATRHVAIMGLGSVGLAVATTMRAEGVRVTGADPDPSAAQRAAALGVEIVDSEAVLSQACDVLVPCAMGQVFDLQAVDALECAAICGSANDQLVDDAAAVALAARGILHAPDIVVSAGAVIEGVCTVLDGATARTRARAAERIAAIEGRVVELLRLAMARGRPPSELAVALADARLGRGA